MVFTKSPEKVRIEYVLVEDTARVAALEAEVKRLKAELAKVHRRQFLKRH